ncbi:MAG: ribosomal-processing cysteine protease Prp [Clostridiaceae bacterium]|nr:ribosomal-processing cysteine protease Prp [Clostridiaceae bacterium]
MTRAVIYKLKDGTINGFKIKGHANAKNDGEFDLVCAAISAIAYTALGGLNELCGVEAWDESDGYMAMRLPDDMAAENRAKAQIILETMEIGLRQVENQYPRHIQVRFEEV